MVVGRGRRGKGSCGGETSVDEEGDRVKCDERASKRPAACGALPPSHFSSTPDNADQWLFQHKVTTAAHLAILLFPVSSRPLFSLLSSDLPHASI